MNSPLRSFAVFAAGLLCLGTCFAVSPGNPAQAADPPPPPQEETNAHTSLPRPSTDTVVIPGPLQPFLRMAGIGQEVSPADVLPMLARNVALRGYEQGRPTEF